MNKHTIKDVVKIVKNLAWEEYKHSKRSTQHSKDMRLIHKFLNAAYRTI